MVVEASMQMIIQKLDYRSTIRNHVNSTQLNPRAEKDRSFILEWRSLDEQVIALSDSFGWAVLETGCRVSETGENACQMAIFCFSFSSFCNGYHSKYDRERVPSTIAR